jgi:small subunit ribosomal protein S16
MSVKIRLQRGGSTHTPIYRVVVAESQFKRDGRFVEVVGTYQPKNKKETEQVKLNLERIEYWCSVGAQPSDTVRTLVNRVRRASAAVAQTA